MKARSGLWPLPKTKAANPRSHAALLAATETQTEPEPAAAAVQGHVAARLQRLSSLALTLHRFQLAVSIIFQLFSVSSASSSSICDASTFRFEFTAITNYKQRKLQHQQQQRVKLAIIFLPR